MSNHMNIHQVVSLKIRQYTLAGGTPVTKLRITDKTGYYHEIALFCDETLDVVGVA